MSNIRIDRFGIAFEARGNSVVWLWWWKRRYGLPLLDLDFQGSFSSWYMLQLAWHQYDLSTGHLDADDYPLEWTWQDRILHWITRW